MSRILMEMCIRDSSNRVAWVECDVNGILGENYYFDKTTSDYYVRGGKYR